MVELKDKLQRWSAYIQDLFNDERATNVEIEAKRENMKTLKLELVYVLNNMKSGKAAGPDRIPIEIFKLFDDKAIDILLELFNAIYDTSIISK